MLRPLVRSAAALWFFSSIAWANDPLLVTVTADEFDGVCDNHCSLRDAVQVANLQPGADHILLAREDYLLARLDSAGEEDGNLTGDLDVTGELIIQGRGQRSRILGSGSSRLLEVEQTADLSLLRLNLQEGYSVDNGGALENHGHLFLHEVQLLDNRAVTADGHVPASEGYQHGQGGAIASYGQLEVHDSLFAGNRAEGMYWDDNLGRGGAIFNYGGRLLVRDSEFRGNRVSDQGDSGIGGALYNAGSADVARSLFIDNSGDELSRGGAIANEVAGTLLLSNSTISGNTSGGVSNGYPGATPLPIARLVNVSIIDNSGYGLYNWGRVVLRNSLVVANRDPVQGGVANCRNVAGSQYQAIGLLLETDADNCSADIYADPAQTFTQLIQPLADNGGPTPTHALRPGSLALDAGIGSCSGHDQRSVKRPLDGDGDGAARCDLGAFEGNLP